MPKHVVIQEAPPTWSRSLNLTLKPQRVKVAVAAQLTTLKQQRVKLKVAVRSKVVKAVNHPLKVAEVVAKVSFKMPVFLVNPLLIR